jgi:hypothetical protein
MIEFLTQGGILALFAFVIPVSVFLLFLIQVKHNRPKRFINKKRYYKHFLQNHIISNT